MNTDTKIVLACIDGSTLNKAVSDYAAWIAKTVEAPLVLLHTIEHQAAPAGGDLSGSIGLGTQERLIEEMTSREQEQNKVRIKEGKSLLSSAKERTVEAGFSGATTCLEHGELVESLVEREESIRVMVIGARGRTHQEKSDQIGTKLESIIRSVHRPVLVVCDAFKEPKNIMVAYDGSEASEKAVDMVAWSPLYKGMTCHLVYVKNKQPAEGVLEKAVNKLKKAQGIELIVTSLDGKVEQELIDYQLKNNIDMTVMGAFSHTRLRDILLGSLTHKMLLKTKKPLLLLR
jgi:nucleotide-binding universal stress UspA family protein